MFAVILAVLFLIMMSIWTLFQVRRDYEEKKGLRAETVASVLGVYTLHFAIELLAALARLWAYQTYQIHSVILGLILGVIGLTFFGFGTLHLGDFRNMTGMESGELVTRGIFRWSRHPQNMGWALILTAVGLISRSGLALLLAGVFWVIFIAYVPMEEKYLESIYGEGYRRYQERTNRYLGIPRRRNGERE